MTLGVPVVAANRGALPEVLGDAGLLVDPDDPDADGGRHRPDAERRDAGGVVRVTRRAAGAAVRLAARRRELVHASYQRARSSIANAHRHRRARAVRARDRRRPLSRRPASRVGDAGGGRQRHEFVLYAPEPIGRALDPRRFANRLVPGRPGTWWEQVQLPAARPADHLDVFFAPAYTAPLRLPVPTGRGDPRRLVRRAPGMVSAARRSAAPLADAPVGVARARGRDDLGILASARLSTRWACPTHASTSFRRGNRSDRRAGRPSDRDERDPLRRLDLQPPPRAGPDSRLRRPRPAPAGARRSISSATIARIRTKTCRRRLRLRDSPAGCGGIATRRGSARGAVRRAQAFAFLSEYEGLGLTPLEALAAGVPPVLLDTPVARESCGDAALYVARGDVEGTARALEEVLFDEATRRGCLPRRRDAGPLQLAARARASRRSRLIAGIARLKLASLTMIRCSRSSSSPSTHAPIWSAAWSRCTTRPRRAARDHRRGQRLDATAAPRRPADGPTCA